MNKKKYNIFIYTFLGVFLIFMVAVAILSNYTNKVFYIISINENGKLKYSDLICNDTAFVHSNIAVQLCNIEEDSLLLMQYFTTDSNKIDYDALMKFTLNSLLHLRVSFNSYHFVYSELVEIELKIENFNDLIVTLTCIYENGHFKIINITNLRSYLKNLDQIFISHQKLGDTT